MTIPLPDAINPKMNLSDIINQQKLIDTDAIFWNWYRFFIFRILSKVEQISFSDLRKFLKVTDGNLASYLRPMENQEFIIVKRGFVGKKRITHYSLSDKGRHQFKRFCYLLSLHLDTEEVVNKA